MATDHSTYIITIPDGNMRGVIEDTNFAGAYEVAAELAADLGFDSVILEQCTPIMHRGWTVRATGGFEFIGGIEPAGDEDQLEVIA